MATNYPLVQLRGPASVGLVFCRTFHHSTMAVATGHEVHHTHFLVPKHLPHGHYELSVIANGIASEPVDIHVGHEEKHEFKALKEPEKEEKHHHLLHELEDEGSLMLELKLPIANGKH